jgi:hypothetical protein
LSRRLAAPQLGEGGRLGVGGSEKMFSTSFDRARGRPKPAIIACPGQDGVTFEGGQDHADATKSD